MNRTRIEKAADKYIRSGKLESAIEELLKLVQLNPRDVTTINRVGDLYSKLGRKQEAIRHFGQIAEHYTGEGFLLKAIAIYKKITKLEPMSLDAYGCLAELYSRQGLTMEARAQYQFIADRCLKNGRNEQGLEALREIERLYPHDVPIRLSIAELLGGMERQDEALEVYRAVGSDLDRKGMHSDSRKVYEAALGLAPRDNGLVRHLVASLTGQGESAPAIELLEGLLQDRPEDPELLSLLGDSHLDGDATGRATECYEKVRELAPERIENLMNDARVCLKDGDLDGGFIHLDDAMRRSEGPEIARRLIPYMQRLLDLEPHHLSGLEALARLNEAVADESACRDAYIRLAGASMEQDDLQAASSALRHLIRLDPKNPRHSERLDQVLLKLRAQGQLPEQVADEAEAAVQAEVAGGGMNLAADEDKVGVESCADLDIEQVAGEPLDQDFIAEHLTEAEVFVKYGLIDKATEQLRTVVGRYPHLLSAREALLEIYREEGKREAAVEECGWIARILREEGDVDGAARVLAEAEQLLPGALSAEPGTSAEVATQEPASSADAEEVALIEDEQDDDYQEQDLDEEELEIDPAAEDAAAQRLEDVDRLLQGGELEQARAVLLQLRSASPASSEVEERLNRVNLLEQQARDADAEGSEEAPGYELAAEMDPELFEPQVAIEEPGDLAEGHAIKSVVAAFRQGIEEQVSPEDFETHYNLGIAYKEMGLVDEAIGEFQFAAKSGEFFTRCCSMLGICFQEKGMTDLAIKWCDRGLEKAEEGEGEEIALGLRYDLAVLCQHSGDSQRALELFTAVYGVDAAYRDVPKHIRELRQSLGQS